MTLVKVTLPQKNHVPAQKWCFEEGFTQQIQMSQTSTSQMQKNNKLFCLGGRGRNKNRSPFGNTGGWAMWFVCCLTNWMSLSFGDENGVYLRGRPIGHHECVAQVARGQRTRGRFSMNPKEDLTELEGEVVGGGASEEGDTLSRVFTPGEPKIFIATHHEQTENAVRALLEMEGWEVTRFKSIEETVWRSKVLPQCYFCGPRAALRRGAFRP